MVSKTALPHDAGGNVISILFPARTAAVSISATSTEANLGSLFSNSACVAWRLQCSTPCNIRTQSGDATSADMPLAANLPEVFEFNSTSTFRVIAGAAGTLWITEML